MGAPTNMSDMTKMTKIKTLIEYENVKALFLLQPTPFYVKTII